MFLIHLSQNREGQVDLLNIVSRLAKDTRRYLPIPHFCSNTCLSFKGGKRIISPKFLLLGHVGKPRAKVQPMPRVRVRVRGDMKPIAPGAVGMQGGGPMKGKAVQRAHA